eukprot:1374735-Amorphochlora_amoeboformis.AAC.1
MQSSSIGFWWMFAISFGIWGSDTVAGSRIELQGAANYSYKFTFRASGRRELLQFARATCKGGRELFNGELLSE